MRIPESARHIKSIRRNRCAFADRHGSTIEGESRLPLDRVCANLDQPTRPGGASSGPGSRPADRPGEPDQRAPALLTAPPPITPAIAPEPVFGGCLVGTQLKIQTLVRCPARTIRLPCASTLSDLAWHQSPPTSLRL